MSPRRARIDRSVGSRSGGIGVLSPEIVVVGGGERGMRIGAADDAELKRIDAELGGEIEAGLERFANVFATHHFLARRSVETSVAAIGAARVGAGVVKDARPTVPVLEIGEFVGRRKHGWASLSPFC